MRQHMLSELAAHIEAPVLGDAQITSITHDTHAITPGALWIAVPGLTQHGIDYLDDALAAGVSAVASDAHGVALANSAGLPTITLDDVRLGMATLASAFYDHPDRGLVLCGITGTNGKTTVAYMVRHILRSSGKSVGMIGTLGTWIDDQNIPGFRTTPESTDLFRTLADMRDAGVTHVVMEVSSHGLALKRVAAMTFDVGVFTNLTQDHLDFHGSMEHYFAAKSLLFNMTRAAVINIDDQSGIRLAAQLPEQILATVGASGQWVASKVHSSLETFTSFVLDGPDGEHHEVQIPVLGSFNVDNAVTSIAVCSLLEVDVATAIRSLESFSTVPGRFEAVPHSGGGRAYVDYAHTPDAVGKVLEAIRSAQPRTVITVIGCGGDRDPSKRFEMGKVASEFSDVVIVTDDNPRSENPDTIRAEVMRGALSGNALVHDIGDRRHAIHAALAMSKDGDVIAVLGKGHEQGQEIAGIIHPFDDREVIIQESQHA